jgi:group II intron reverse transcriptase/maturase
MRMQNAATILAVIGEQGRRGLPLERIYRQLYNRDLFLYAYGRISRNRGALTRGVTAETVDGMSLAKIEAIIEALRFERYRWTPVRRAAIPKANGKTRPLGIPTWSDKLVQEVLRLILDAYYEPQFSDHSHGFRPRRGCHTALSAVYTTFQGTTWFIEGDIAACFDRFDHQVLRAILAEKIHDHRFLRLIDHLLQAGYLEDWRFHETLSGTPQGGIVSPVLANIYLSRLDRFVETVLVPAHTRGELRRLNPRYGALKTRAYKARRAGRWEAAQLLKQQMQRLPSVDPHDASYRRLRYVRYADDFLLGFVGPRHEAEAIKAQLRDFLRDSLKLELSEAKTLLTHARTEKAHFLGYEVNVAHNDHLRDQTGKRSSNGVIGLAVPPSVIDAKCARYSRRGKPVHRPALLHNAEYSIVEQYQVEYRGVALYYALAHNRHTLSRLRWVMEQSLVKTLAHKLRLTVSQVYDRFQDTIATPQGPRRGLTVRVVRGNGKKPLVAHWGGISLARQPHTVLHDRPPRIWNARTEVVERLLADTCELCGSQERVQVHHARALKDFQKPGRATKPKWVQLMAARHRKTLVVCEDCHTDIHHGRLVCRACAN